MRFIILFSFLNGIGFAAHASPLNKINHEKSVCLAQSYTENQLRQRPLQTVRSLSLQLYQQPDLADQTIYLNMQIETNAQVFDAFMICDRNGQNLSCAVECDGGQAQLVSVGDHPTQLQFVNKGFLMSGGCGPGEEAEVWLAPTTNGDDVFNLEELDEQHCQ